MSKRQKPAQRRVPPSAGATDADAVGEAGSPPAVDLVAAPQPHQEQVVARPPPRTAAATAAAIQAEIDDAQRRDAEAQQQRREHDALVRAKVVQLQQEKGEAAVQQMLVQTIQKLKKRESEIAVAKKRKEATARECEQLAMDHKRLQIQAHQHESSIRILTEDTLRIEEETQTTSKAMCERRAEVRDRIEGEVRELREGLEKQVVEDEALVTENAALKAQFEAERGLFDEAFKQHEQSWAAKETATKQLIRELSGQLNETQMLDAKLIYALRELRQMEDEIAVYREQLATYSSKFDGFDQIAMKSDDVEKIAQAQKKQLQDKFDLLEGEKKRANELKVEFDKEALAQRAKLAALKKKMTLLEKNKSSLETKCRKEAEKQLAKK